MSVRIIILISICVITTSPSLFAKESHEYSGFLRDYPKFERNKETGAEVWFKSKEEGVKVLRPYKKILLSPIEVWLSNDSYKGINPDTLKAITDYFTLAIQKELSFRYSVVSEPGPDVLHIRIAITNVKRTKPKRKLYGYIPVALVVEGGKKVARKRAGKTVDLIEATVEMEGLDSVTGERIVAAIDTQQSDKIKREKGSASWGPIKEILDYWASRLRINFHKARGLY